MSQDQNNNGVKDSEELTIHWKSLLLGSVLTLALGGSVIGFGKVFFPTSTIVIGIGKWFAGSACDFIEENLNKCREAWSCIEGGAAITGADISVCSAKLHKKP